jgi:hypothetical protein
VAQALANDLHGHAPGKEQGRVCVAQIVEADARYARAGDELREPSCNVIGVEP